MKAKRFISTIAAVAAISTMTVSASAADWSQASYADNDPSTVKMISQTKDSITFTTSDLNSDICKARITLNKVLANPADYSKIASATWTVTYKGVKGSYDNYQLSGGTYFVNSNSEGYKIDADDVDDDYIGTWASDTYTVTDSFTTTDPLTEDGEIVFMDWSMADIGGAGIEVTISDFKMFDASGAEIAQLGYGEYNAADFEVVDESEDTPVEEPVTDSNETVDASSSDDNNTVENVKTGNAGVTTAIAAIACAAAALVATSKRK